MPASAASTMLAMLIIFLLLPSVARDQLELASIAERRRLEPGHQERRQALQQQLVVVLVAGVHLREELERVGARERVRQRSHHEMQPPRELLAREVRQRL